MEKPCLAFFTCLAPCLILSKDALVGNGVQSASNRNCGPEQAKEGTPVPPALEVVQAGNI